MEEMDDFLGSEIRIDPYLLKREDAQRRSYLKKSTYLSRSFKRRKPLFPETEMRSKLYVEKILLSIKHSVLSMFK